MSRSIDQQNNRETFSKQNQMRRTTDFQSVPDATNRMNGTSRNSNSRQLSMPSEKVGAQRDMGSRPSNQGKGQQMRQPSSFRGENKVKK